MGIALDVMIFVEIEIKVCLSPRDNYIASSHYNDASLWAPWRLKSPASPLFAQLLVQARVTGLRAGNLPVADEYPVQKASNVKNVSSIWWRHRAMSSLPYKKSEVTQLSIFMAMYIWV